MKPGPPPEFGSLYRHVTLLKKPHIWFDRYRETWWVRRSLWAKEFYTREAAFKYAQSRKK